MFGLSIKKSLKTHTDRKTTRPSTAILVSTVWIVALTACSSQNQMQRPPSAAIGALAGAVVGAATSSKSDRKKGVLIGAAVGGGIGLYMDKQEAKLKAELENSGIEIEREEDEIKLNMPGALTFATNEATIAPQFYSVLTNVAAVLKEYQDTRISIIGHTDSTGSEAYNQSLSQRRAQSVGSYLSSQGVSSARFQVSGYGESAPVADNATAQGRAQNRRVEVRIIPISGG